MVYTEQYTSDVLVIMIKQKERGIEELMQKMDYLMSERKYLQDDIVDIRTALAQRERNNFQKRLKLSNP